MRISRDQLFFGITELVAHRSTCLRAEVGAIIVIDDRPVSMGYAGAPAGFPHCTDVGCDIEDSELGCQRTVHAEANAIAFAARKGIAIQGGTLYCTFSPCKDCAMLIINAGIKVVKWQVNYRDISGIVLLKSAGLTGMPILEVDCGDGEG